MLDTGVATAAYPGHWRLLVSDDGETWSEPVARGRGSGQLTTVRLPDGPLRHLRVELTGPRAEPWTVADVRIYH